jgi:hypothetical protein
MRSENEIVSVRDNLLKILEECRNNRSLPGRSDALKASDSITSCIAAAQLNALQFVLGETKSPMIRSSLLKL